MNRATRLVSAFAFGVGTVSCSWLLAQAPGAAPQGQNAQGKAGAVQPGGKQPGGAPGINTNMRFGVRQNPWFANQAVRQQLRMNDEQFNNLNRNYSTAWNRFNQGVTGFGTDLNDAQRTQKMQELNSSFNRDFSTSIEKQFADAQQQQRFNQMYLQYQGPGAFSDPSVRTRLNLTDEQNQRLNALSGEWNSKIDPLSGGFRTDPQGTTKRFGELRSDINQRLNSILNAEQQKTWREMAGESFDFPASVYFDGDVDAKTGAGTAKESPVRKP